MFTQSVKFWKVRLRETIIIKEIVSFFAPKFKAMTNNFLKKRRYYEEWVVLQAPCSNILSYAQKFYELQETNPPFVIFSTENK